MITIRKLEIDDAINLDQLIDMIENNLVNKDWWLPIKDIARNHFFDQSWTIFYGAFDNGRLVAASGLFLNDFEFGECAEILCLDKRKTAEIGRCMVEPLYRGRNLMLSLNQYLLKKAMLMNRTSIIATAHPDNLASNISLMKLGMSVEKSIIKQGRYPRNILKVDITKRM